MKKIILTFITIYALVLPLKAQQDPNFTPFAFGANVGGFFCSANPNQAGLSQLSKIPVAGFSIGAVTSFRKRAYYIETGLNYNSEGYAYSSSVVTNKQIKSQSNEYKFYSLVLPLRFIKPIQGFNCKHLPSFAVNFSYAVRRTNLQVTEYQNAPLTKNVYNVTSDYGKLTPSFTVAYGVEFDIDVFHALRFEPTIQFSMVNAKSSANKAMISNIGIRAYFLYLR